MTIEFNIIEEHLIDFGFLNQLWTMIIRDGERYAVEVNTRYESLGRLYCRNRKQAEILLPQFDEQIKLCGDFFTAADLMDLGFSFSTLPEIMFVINTRHRKYNFNTLCKLRSIYKYKTTPGIEDLIWENKEYNKRIIITFPGKTQPIGWFKPLTEEDGSDFIVELNPESLKKD